MLQNLTSITGVGLFSDATVGANLPLSRVTLIYAENGRGKSTLASVLAAASIADPNRIKDRVTIDQDVKPKVSLHLDDGSEVSFDGEEWTEPLSAIRVFDSHFIEENVHSGHEVTSDQRKNLLHFALGTQAVSAQETERTATQDKKDAEASLALLNADIRAYSDGLSVQDFESLPAVADVDAQIASKQIELAAARSQKSILNQVMPIEHTLPGLDLDSIFETLSRTLEDVHAQAETEISKHLADLNQTGALDWISEGQKFDSSSTCPYCGQDTSCISLITSYRTHFDKAYLALQKSIQKAIEEVEKLTLPSVVTLLQDHRVEVNTAISVWQGTGVTLHTMTGTTDELASADLASFRQQMSALLHAKLEDLANVHHTSDSEREIRNYWDRFMDVYLAENGMISKHRETIETFKASIVQINVPELETQLRTFRLSKVRHSVQVNAKTEELKRVRLRLAEAETSRTQARIDLTDLMDKTLDKYATQINEHLKKYSAAFKIDKLSTNYLGSVPRTKYGIKLRDKLVNLSGSSPSFRTALSEGDKRTMAFAFFAASTLADPDLGKKIVVIDDPMSSLDRNRRSHTVSVLKMIAERCDQLIVLAHDPKFLLDTLDHLSKIKVNIGLGKPAPIGTSCLQISPQADLYSDITACDLVRECESQYVMHYRRLTEFVDNPSRDSGSAASAIRPLLEGYLHRRFPGALPRNEMFGRAITKIEKAPGDSPLSSAKKIVEELRDIAYFGGSSHHDTDPDMPWSNLNVTEIHGYAQRALQVVHGL